MQAACAFIELVACKLCEIEAEPMNLSVTVSARKYFDRMNAWL
jgi:hypothetical protein